MCATCHGAPGKDPGEIGLGLTPQPPRLEEEASLVWSAQEMFWIVKNDIRMTGMSSPASVRRVPLYVEIGMSSAVGIVTPRWPR